MSGAVTNTPGLGAAQQAYADTAGAADETISLGYAVAYPLGVVGIIFTMIALRYIYSEWITAKENEGLAAISHESSPAHRYSVEFTNRMLEGRTIAYVRELINRQFVISRIMHGDGSITMADGDSRLSSGDRLRVICSTEDSEAILAFFGRPIEMTADEWGASAMQSTPLVSRRILITRHAIKRQEVFGSAAAHTLRHKHHAREPRRRRPDTVSGHGVAGGRQGYGRRPRGCGGGDGEGARQLVGRSCASPT